MTTSDDNLPGVATVPPSPDHKPEMSRKDASFYLAKAASDARKEATQEGAPEHEVAAFMNTDPVQVGPFLLQRMGARIVWAMEEAAKCFTGSNASIGFIATQAITVLAFTEPQKLYHLARAGKAEEIEEWAWKIADDITPEIGAEINRYVVEEQKRVNRLNGVEDKPADTPGKPTAES